MLTKAPLSRARTIVRTEAGRVQEQANFDAANKAKAAGADVVKQWSAVLDGKTRDTHRELDHQIREMDKPFETHGKKAMYPHHFGDPAEDCNCRCTLLTRARAALDADELKVMQERAEFFGLDKTDSFTEFKEKYLKAAEQQVSTKFIKDAKDFDSLEKYLKKAYNINVDTSVKQLDFATVKTTLEGVESMLNEFPGLANELGIIETGKSGVMACFGQSITFNPAFFQTQGKLQDECKKAVNSKWWVDNASPASIGVHESAHAVEWMLLQKNSTYHYDWERITAWNDCTEAKRIVSQACKNVKKTASGKGKRNAELISSIFKYAQSNPSETMAEAFADVYANGNNAKPLSKEIKRLTIEILEAYEKGE